MKVYFLFKLKNEDYTCSYIFNEEHSKVFSYSYDEDYIVKSEESNYKKLEDVETAFSRTSKSKKSKDANTLLEKKDFPDIKHALFFLEGNHDDFKAGIQSRKKLPKIITPYEMDFEESDEFENLKDDDLEVEAGEDNLFKEFKDFGDEEDESTDDFDDDDDLYR